MNRLGLLSAVAITAMGCGASASRQNATLDNLRAGMEWVRAARIDSQRTLARQPPVDDLVGSTGADLARELGAPHVCTPPLESPCRAAGETLWAFYRGYARGEGVGPVLVVELDEHDRVISAGWRRAEVEADAPLAIDRPEPSIAAAPDEAPDLEATP